MSTIYVYIYLHEAVIRVKSTGCTHFQDQYIFVYDCLLEALICGDTLMYAEEYKELLADMCQFDNSIQKTKLEEQFDVRNCYGTKALSE